MMNNTTIEDIKQQIQEIQEYINTELCKKCEEMKLKLTTLESMLVEYSEKNKP